MADAAGDVLHGALHPVHHVGVHHHGLVVLHPGGGDVVGIHPGGVSPAGVHVIAGGLHLLRRLVKLIPVGHGGAYGLRVVGAQDGLGDGAAVDQHSGGGLVAQSPDLTVGAGHGLQGVAVLVGDVRVGDPQLRDGERHIDLRVDIFQGVVRLHQEHVNPVVGGHPALLEQRLIQLLLIDAVLGGVDNPVNLGAVLQIGDGFVVRKPLYPGVILVELALKLLVPHVDVQDLAAVAGLYAAEQISSSAAASAQKAEHHHGHQSGRPNPSLHVCFLLFLNLIQPAAVILSLL